MNKKVGLFIGLLIGIAVLWRMLFFAVSVQRVNVSGDESIMALQAIGITQDATDPLFRTKQHPPGWAGRFPLLFMAQPYLFPVESYLMAPFIRWLPHNAFGLRLVPMVMGILGCLVGVSLLRRWGRRAGWTPWLPVLLIVLPSAYVLMLQSVYMLPSYPGFMLLAVLALWLADKNRTVSSWNPLWALLAGFCAGLAASNTLMALPFLGSICVMVAVGRSWRRMLVGLPGVAVGAVAGLFPFYVAKELYPGAHAAVSSMVPLPEALGRLWSPAVSFTLPVALGIRSTLMPDTLETVGLIPAGVLPAAAGVWLVVMIAVSVLCVVRFVQRSWQARWPDIHVADVLTGLSWVYLLLFVMSTRFGSHEFRYLLPMVYFAPFVLCWAMLQGGKVMRWAVGCVCACLLLMNMVTPPALLQAWTNETFDGYFTDTRPAIEYLQERGINRCYSSYFDVYSINYLSGEKVVCAQPFNERFFGWPYPYIDLVDRATNVAYVLGPGNRFRREDFERDLAERGISYEKKICGACWVYTDFVNPDMVSGKRIDPDEVSVKVSHWPDDAASLSDGVLTHLWRSHTAQEKGMWIKLCLADAKRLDRMRFYYNGYPHDHAKTLNIYILENGSMKPLAMDVPFMLSGFDFVNGHPVYGNQVQELDLDGIMTDMLMVELSEVNAGRDWTIGEIELYEAVGD